MINWFNIPDEGLSNGGLFEVKELEVTENGTYETKGEMYNKVTVNVEGGGGESDLTYIIPEQTITIPEGSRFVEIQVDELPEPSGGNFVCAVTKFIVKSNNFTAYLGTTVYKSETRITIYGLMDELNIIPEMMYNGEDGKWYFRVTDMESSQPIAGEYTISVVQF